MKAILEYIKERFTERSTYLLLIASLGSVAGLDAPFNWIGFVALLAAAMSPDGAAK